MGNTSNEIVGDGVLMMRPDNKIEGYLIWKHGNIAPEEEEYLSAARKRSYKEIINGTYTPGENHINIYGISVEAGAYSAKVDDYELELLDNNTIKGKLKGEKGDWQQKLAGGYTTDSNTDFQQYRILQDWRNEARKAETQFEAVLYYALAIEADTSCELCYYGRGLGYKSIYNFPQAERDYTRAINLNPNRAYYFLKRGEVYSWLKKHIECINDCSRALELELKDNRSVASAYWFRAISYQYLNEDEKAVDDFTNCMNVDSGHVSYYNRAVSYYKLKNYEKAIEDCNTSFRWDTKSAEVHFLRGKCYEEQKRYDLAVKDYESALAIEPTHEDVRKHLDALKSKR